MIKMFLTMAAILDFSNCSRLYSWYSPDIRSRDYIASSEKKLEQSMQGIGAWLHDYRNNIQDEKIDEKIFYYSAIPCAPGWRLGVGVNFKKNLFKHIILRGYHMGGSVIWFLSNKWWCDITNERGTSEWEISHHHEFDKIISQCHPCDYLFIIYHNTRTNRNFVHTYHSHIYYTSTHCHFLTLQIAVCLSCQT